MKTMPQGMHDDCTALVLAGQRGQPDPVAVDAGTSHKALVPVCGRPMLAHVVSALLESRPVRRVVISIEDPALVRQVPELRSHLESGAVDIVKAAGSPSESVRAYLSMQTSAVRLIVTTADHPLLTPAIVEHFWNAVPPKADIAAGVSDLDALQTAYPQSVRTCIRFRDAAITGANLFALMSERSALAVAFWNKMERYRKRPFRMIGLLGISATLRFLLRWMTLEEALTRFSRKSGVIAAVIRLPFPEAGIDVDKPSDLALAEAILARRLRMPLPETLG
jgi:GTP:adenosylcobinamide-phosphate guanylyltransferase